MHKYRGAEVFYQGRSTVNTILKVALIFLSDVYEKDSSRADSAERRIQRSDVKPPRTVFLSEEDVRLMQSFREEFDRIGGQCVFSFCCCLSYLYTRIHCSSGCFFPCGKVDIFLEENQLLQAS